MTTLRRSGRSSDYLLGALLVADFQVMELRDVGKLVAGNAHRRAGLSQGGGELVRLLLASVRGIEGQIHLDREGIGIPALPFDNAR